MAVSSVARLADDRARGKNDPDAVEAVDGRAGSAARAQFSGTPYPPTGAASGAVALSKLVGRVEWVAGNTAMLGDEHWSTEPPAALAVTRASGGDAARRRRRSSVTRTPTRSTTRRASSELQESTRRLDRLIGAELEADVSVADAIGSRREAPCPVPPDRNRSRRRASPARSIPGSTPGRSASPPRWWPTPRSRRQGPSRSARPADGDGRPESPRPVRAPALLPSLVPLGLVPQRRAGRHRSGHRRRGRSRSPTSRTASGWFSGTLSVLRSNALGTGATAVRAVGGHRARRGRRLGHHDRRRGPLRPAVGAAPAGGARLGHGTVDDLLRRRAGRLHLDGDHPVQHHRSPSGGRWGSRGSRTSPSAVV